MQDPTDPISTPLNVNSLACRKPITGIYYNYLVLAPDMATYDGHRIEGYQWVMTRSKCEEDALDHASFALEDGVLPLVALTTTDLRQLADDLEARQLEPREAYNESFEPPDEEESTQTNN